MSSPPRNITGDERTRNKIIAINVGALVASPMRSNPVPLLPLSPQASSPTSVTPATTVTSCIPSTSSVPLSQDVIKLSALYQSSRRSRSSGEKNTQLLPASTLNLNLLPPPPLHSVNDERHGQKQELGWTSTQQDKTFDTMMSMQETSSSSTRMRSPTISSSFTSSNSRGLEPNPPMNETSTKQPGINLRKDDEVADEMVWSSRHNSDEVIAGAPHSDLPIQAVSSTSALSDGVEYNQVRRRLTCDNEEDVVLNSDSNGSYLDLLLQPPSKKSKLTSSNEGSTTNYSNTTTTFQCSKTMSNPLNKSDTDDDERMSPVTEQVFSGDKEEEPRRSSITIEDLEEDQRRSRMESVIDDSQDELIRRKIERLLLIRHCTKCSIRSKNIADPGYFCPVTSRCAEGKALCAHIKKCKRADCTYKKCLTTREVLGHYMKCRDASCKICGPVRSRDKRRRNQKKDDIEWRHANMLL